MAGKAAGRLPGLDTLRGIAAASVMIFHATVVYDHGFGVGKAYLAVDFFFALSGYVMARTYETRFAAGMSWSVFLDARLSRLYPAMVIGGAFGLILLRQTMPDIWIEIAILNMLMVPVLAGQNAFPLNIAAWSILFELIANLLHHLVFRRTRTSTLVKALFPLGAILAMIALPRGIDVGSTPKTLMDALPRVLFSYTLGIVLWRWLGDKAPFWLPQWLTFAALPAYFAGIWALDIESGWADLLFIFLISPLVLSAGLSAAGGRLGEYLGALSFPLYAIQFPVLQLLHRWGYSVAAGVALCVLIAIGVTAALATTRRLGGWFGPRLATAAK